MWWAGLAAGLCLCNGCSREQAPIELSAAEARIDRAWISPGEPFRVGLRIRLAPGWHTYADPPGDSGMAPVVHVVEPEGVEKHVLAYPPHQTFRDEVGLTYGYENEVVLVQELSLPALPEPAGEIELKIRLDYLICKEACIPRSATLDLSVPVQERSAPVDAGWDAFLRQGGWPHES